MVERFRETVSTERLPDRIARMVAQLEAASDPTPKKPRAKKAVPSSLSF
jgi:ATP-dependent Lhr-like helicase